MLHGAITSDTPDMLNLIAFSCLRSAAMVFKIFGSCKKNEHHSFKLPSNRGFIVRFPFFNFVFMVYSSLKQLLPPEYRKASKHHVVHALVETQNLTSDGNAFLAAI
jgi:hypothetical protein